MFPSTQVNEFLDGLEDAQAKIRQMYLDLKGTSDDELYWTRDRLSSLEAQLSEAHSTLGGLPKRLRAVKREIYKLAPGERVSN